MVGSAKKHVDELLKLPPDERSEAVEALLLSLEQEPEEEEAEDVESFEQDRHAVALLKLALQGDADIAEGRVVSRAEYKKRLAALIKSRQVR
jgi:hypothetical protein